MFPQEAVGSGDEFVTCLLSSLPDIALEWGVYTEDSIKERFDRVERYIEINALFQILGQ